MIQEIKNLCRSAVLYFYNMTHFPTLISKDTAYVEVNEDLIGDEPGNKLQKTIEYVLRHKKVTTLIINLGQVVQIDCYSIAQLLVAHREMSNIQGKLQFHSVQENVKETFDLIMFSRVIEAVEIEWPKVD